MGALPSERVTVSKPFAHCGVNYTGPVILREGKRRNARNHKAYISIFVCFATKAIHIELVSDLGGLLFHVSAFLFGGSYCEGENPSACTPITEPPSSERINN